MCRVARAACVCYQSTVVNFFVARENSGEFFRGTGILPVPRMRFGVLCAGEWELKVRATAESGVAGGR